MHFGFKRVSKVYKKDNIESGHVIQKSQLGDSIPKLAKFEISKEINRMRDSNFSHEVARTGLNAMKESASKQGGAKNIWSGIKNFIKKIPGIKELDELYKNKFMVKQNDLENNRISTDATSSSKTLGMQYISKRVINNSKGIEEVKKLQNSKKINKNEGKIYWKYLNQSLDQEKIDKIYSEVKVKISNWLLKNNLLKPDSKIVWPGLDILKLKDSLIYGGYIIEKNQMLLNKETITSFYDSELLETIIHEVLHGLSNSTSTHYYTNREDKDIHNSSVKIGESLLQGLRYDSYKNTGFRYNTAIDEAIIDKTALNIMKEEFPKEYKKLNMKNESYIEEKKVVNFLVEKAIKKTNGFYTGSQLEMKFTRALINGVQKSDIKFIDNLFGEGTARLLNNFRIDSNANILLEYLEKTEVLNVPTYRVSPTRLRQDFNRREAQIERDQKNVIERKTDAAKIIVNIGDYDVYAFTPSWTLFEADDLDPKFVEINFQEQMADNQTQIELSGLDQNQLPDINITGFKTTDNFWGRSVDVRKFANGENGLNQKDVEQTKGGLPNEILNKLELVVKINTLLSRYRPYFNQRWAKNELLNYSKESHSYNNKSTTIAELYKSIKYIVALENAKQKIINLYNQDPRLALVYVKSEISWSNGKDYLQKPTFKNNFEILSLQTETRKILLNNLLEALNFPERIDINSDQLASLS